MVVHPPRFGSGEHGGAHGWCLRYRQVFVGAAPEGNRDHEPEGSSVGCCWEHLVCVCNCVFMNRPAMEAYFTLQV